MKQKKLYALILLLLCLQTLSAQEMLVTDFKMSQGDITASTSPRLDTNGDACALLVVHCSDEITGVEGNYVGDVVNKGFEKRIYMSPGSKQIKILFKNHLPLVLLFVDYNINSLESKYTYVLTLVENTSGPTTYTGNQYLVMNIFPKQASAYIDGNPEKISDEGALLKYLPYGDHTYRVDAPGYKGQSGDFTIVKDRKTAIDVKLQSVMATLSVTCPTPQSHLFINNSERGTDSWKGQMIAGSYMLEARKEGYRSQSKSVTLSESEQREVEIPALQAIVGSINVGYSPANAEVYIDGTKVGTSPDIFRDIMVGSHHVEIRKSGYESAQLNVMVKENAVSDVNGSLKQRVVASPSSSSSSSSSNSGGYSSLSSSSGSSSILPFTVNGVTFKMVKVDGGTFTMGATNEQASDAFDNEKPAHSVTLSSYYIGQTEVTQALWTAVMKTNPSFNKGENKPVDNVSYHDCQIFIIKLNNITNLHFSLPTEEQWEYAARGGNKSHGYVYSGGNNISEVAWINNDGEDSINIGSHVVASFRPNELGIYDMSGNISEWCQNKYVLYNSFPKMQKIGNTSSSMIYPLRGGCFKHLPLICRVSCRCYGKPLGHNRTNGFRIVLNN